MTDDTFYTEVRRVLDTADARIKRDNEYRALGHEFVVSTDAGDLDVWGADASPKIRVWSVTMQFRDVQAAVGLIHGGQVRWGMMPPFNLNPYSGKYNITCGKPELALYELKRKLRLIGALSDEAFTSLPVYAPEYEDSLYIRTLNA